MFPISLYSPVNAHNCFLSKTMFWLRRRGQSQKMLGEGKIMRHNARKITWREKMTDIGINPRELLQQARSIFTQREIAQYVGKDIKTVRRWEKGLTPCPVMLGSALRDLMRQSAGYSATCNFRFIDLFAGIGGLRLGFEGIGGHCVFTSEWDTNAQKTYAMNFRDNHPLAGDIREYSEAPERIPEHDVLLAGFPCQPFSIAGVSKKNALGRPHGFLCDTQGTLFFDTAQIIAWHRPAVFVLENVKNLESHDRGQTFATIMNVLENELGYHVQTRVISSEHWVPQKRERIFIVGFREPVTFDLKGLKLPEGGPKLGSILQPHDEVDQKYTLTPRLWEYLQAYKKSILRKATVLDTVFSGLTM